MNWDAIGAVSELVGAIAVLATLFYLALQVRQNTNALRASATHSVQDASRQQLMAVAHDVSLMQLFNKMRANEELSFDERDRLAWYFEASLRHHENAFYLNRAGLLDADLFESHTIDIDGMTKQFDYSRRYWAASRGNFSHAFREYVDGVISDDQ